MELESEKAVTALLAEKDVLKPASKNIYKVLNRKDLGKFLQNATATEEKKKTSKYSFITLGLWKW